MSDSATLFAPERLERARPKRGRPLDIQIVLHDLPLGGTERVALRLASAWADAGHAPRLFCGSLTGAQAPLVDPRVELVEAAPALPRGPGSRARLGRALAGHLSRRPADVLFIPGNFHWCVAGPVAQRLGAARPALVAQVSSPLVRAGRTGLRQSLFEIGARARLRAVDALVTLSPRTTVQADRILGQGRATAIPLPALNDTAPTLSPARGRTILAIGRLAPEKGFDVALRSFAALNDPEARLVLLGEGPEEAALRALAQTLGIADQVTFAGYVRDPRPWLARARLLLVSSWHEGFGAVIVEALGMGRPVVATDCTPAALDLLGAPGCGRLAPVGDVAALSAALAEELRAPAPDPEALAAQVADYRLGPVAEAYVQLFQRVIARRAAQPARAFWDLSRTVPALDMAPADA